MIRVLVAEDEPPILRAINSLIERTNPSFTVTATAADGAMAVELLEKEPFDVVFTDIRMPVMDGLALLEYVHERHPEICTVVLSGYNEFEYAQQALKSRAYDYLLKPVSPEQLAILLEKLEAGFAVRNKADRKRQISRSINRIPDETAPEAAGDGRLYVVMLVCAGPFLYDEGDSLSPGAAFWEVTDANAIVAGALTGGADFWTFRGETAADRIVVAELPPGCKPKDIVNRVFGGIAGACGIPVTMIGYGEPVGIQSAGRAYRILRKALLPAVKIGRSSVSWTDSAGVLDGETDGFENAGPDESRITESLAAAVRVGSLKSIDDNLHAAMQYLENCGSSQIRIARFLQNVLEGSLKGTVIPPQAAAEKRREVLEAVSGSVSFEMLLGNSLVVFSALAEEAGSRPGKQTSARRQPVIGRIEAFLQRNYRESITNLTLSQEFGFVPSYVSKIFREHTGLSVSDYLVKIRMDRAKQLLQENPGIMVKEVADQVGFKDQYHFSKTFKRQTGMWPTEYRR